MKSTNSQAQQLSQQPILPHLLKKWIPKTLFRHGDKKKKLTISRSRLSAASTVFLILASLLPYADIFVSPFVDTSVPMRRFPNLSTAIWSYATCITPLLILAASRFKPYWFGYIVPIYVYVTMFCGFLFLDLNINIKSDWLFRLVTLSLSVILLGITRFLIKICAVVRFKEDIMDEMIKFKNNG